MLDSSAGFYPAPVNFQPQNQQSAGIRITAAIVASTIVCIGLVLCSLDDNLTYRPIRSACQLLFDRVLAKIVTDCHGRDLWRGADFKGVCRSLGYIVMFFIDSKKNKHYKT
jgi:hypothetical protein